MALLPGGTTQWDDIHRKLGNFAPKEKVVGGFEVEIPQIYRYSKVQI